MNQQPMNQKSINQPPKRISMVDSYQDDKMYTFYQLTTDPIELSLENTLNIGQIFSWTQLLYTVTSLNKTNHSHKLHLESFHQHNLIIVDAWTGFAGYDSPFLLVETEQNGVYAAPLYFNTTTATTTTSTATTNSNNNTQTQETIISLIKLCNLFQINPNDILTSNEFDSITTSLYSLQVNQTYPPTVSMRQLRQMWAQNDPYLASIIQNYPQYTNGVRILDQSGSIGECLWAFICSQNNNTKRIAQNVHKTSQVFGKHIGTIELKSYIPIDLTSSDTILTTSTTSTQSPAQFFSFTIYPLEYPLADAGTDQYLNQYPLYSFPDYQTMTEKAGSEFETILRQQVQLGYRAAYLPHISPHFAELKNGYPVKKSQFSSLTGHSLETIHALTMTQASNALLSLPSKHSTLQQQYHHLQSDLLKDNKIVIAGSRVEQQLITLLDISTGITPILDIIHPPDSRIPDFSINEPTIHDKIQNQQNQPNGSSQTNFNTLALSTDITPLTTLRHKFISDLLCTFLGVGEKVASCIGLFSLQQHNNIPMDVHVHRLMIKHYPRRAYTWALDVILTTLFAAAATFPPVLALAPAPAHTLSAPTSFSNPLPLDTLPSSIHQPTMSSQSAMPQQLDLNWQAFSDFLSSPLALPSSTSQSVMKRLLDTSAPNLDTSIKLTKTAKTAKTVQTDKTDKEKELPPQTQMTRLNALSMNEHQFVQLDASNDVSLNLDKNMTASSVSSLLLPIQTKEHIALMLSRFISLQSSPHSHLQLQSQTDSQSQSQSPIQAQSKSFPETHTHPRSLQLKSALTLIALYHELYPDLLHFKSNFCTHASALSLPLPSLKPNSTAIGMTHIVTSRVISELSQILHQIGTMPASSLPLPLDSVRKNSETSQLPTNVIPNRDLIISDSMMQLVDESRAPKPNPQLSSAFEVFFNDILHPYSGWAHSVLFAGLLRIPKQPSTSKLKQTSPQQSKSTKG